MKTGMGSILAALLLLSPAIAQEKPAMAPMAEECMKHCRQMAEARQKAMDARKAHMEKMDAAFKDVRAQLDAARTLRGDKKVAALEAAMEKLVSFHESMRAQMDEAGGMGPGMAGHHAGMMGMGSCCSEMGAMSDCPMMK